MEKKRKAAYKTTEQQQKARVGHRES